MKKNVMFIVKLVVISILLVVLVGAKSFAAEVNMNSIDFTNIPESDASGSNNGGSVEDEAAKKKAEEEAAKKKAEEEAKKKAEEAKKKTTSTSTSSASKEKMPATGSNVEIIFAVGAIVLVSGAIFLFRKQNIKIK